MLLGHCSWTIFFCFSFLSCSETFQLNDLEIMHFSSALQSGDSLAGLCKRWTRSHLFSWRKAKLWNNMNPGIVL